METIMMYPVPDDNSSHPTMIELRSAEYRHTGIRLPLATIRLCIDPGLPILDDWDRGKHSVRTAIETYFRIIHTPAVKDKDIFLPKKYAPYMAAAAADDIRNGKTTNTDIAKYIQGHHGALVIDMDSVYINYRAGSYLAKIWILDTDFSFLTNPT